MKMWRSRPAPGAPATPGGAVRRRVLTAGAVTATVVGSLALGSTAAHATLASGTPLKTLAMADGSRYFGSDMTGNLLSQSTVTQLQSQQFDMVTPGNEMKWDTTEPSNGSFNFSPGDQIVAYAQANSERVRCHNLVWQSQLPSWVSSLPSSQVQAAMETHITTEAGHFKGECYAWDVVNEPFNGDGSFVADPFFNAMGSGYIADALKTAHAADPNAKLYLNDFNIEGENAKSNAMFSLAQSLLAAGVPLNGIGFESHFILGGIPSDMEANMQRFANLGLDVAVTELDDRINLPASTANLQQQATEFAQVVKDCLGVTRCVGVTQWAVGDADSWVPGTFSGQGAATMFDQNYNAKPAFTAVQQALGGGTANVVTVTNPGNQTNNVGGTVSLQIQATDSSPGQTLSYAATGLPAGLSINAATGLISGTPTTAANNTVTVTATDGTGTSGAATFLWTIGTGTDTTVVVTNPGNQTGTVGTAASLQIQASDTPAGQTLTYSATGLPAGLSINAATGLISGTPTTAGNNTVTVTVKDPSNNSGSATFTWIITGGGGTCHVTYTRNSQWPGGWTAQVVIANMGTTAITSWSLTFTFPGDQKVTQNYNGGFSQTGENVTLTNASYNGAIAAGGSVTDGFQGSWTSNDTNPSSFSVNGSACN